MNTISYSVLRYRIVLRGECGGLLAGLAAGLAVESGQGRTCVIATVRDESEFYGLLDRLQDFALHIISLSELGAGLLPAQDATGG